MHVFFEELQKLQKKRNWKSLISCAGWDLIREIQTGEGVLKYEQGRKQESSKSIRISKYKPVCWSSKTFKLLNKKADYETVIYAEEKYMNNFSFKAVQDII